MRFSDASQQQVIHFFFKKTILSCNHLVFFYFSMIKHYAVLPENFIFFVVHSD